MALFVKQRHKIGATVPNGMKHFLCQYVFVINLLLLPRTASDKINPLILNLIVTMQKILLTGNLGYIGPVVVNALKTHFPKCNIAGFDIGYFKDCIVDERLFKSEVDQQIMGDTRDISENVLEGVDAICAGAAKTKTC